MSPSQFHKIYYFCVFFDISNLNFQSISENKREKLNRFVNVNHFYSGCAQNAPPFKNSIACNYFVSNQNQTFFDYIETHNFHILCFPAEKLIKVEIMGRKNYKVVRFWKYPF